MSTKYFLHSNAQVQNIDLENAEINSISLITTGEIKGHGLELDEYGLDSFHRAVDGGTVKAYYKHADNEALDSIGFFSNFRKEQDDQGRYKLVGDFSALEAWKTNNPKEFETFFELSVKAPEILGVSVEATIATYYYNEEGERVQYEGEEEAEGKALFAECVDVLAWSIVASPAANPNGLFSSDIPNADWNGKIIEEEKPEDLEPEPQIMEELQEKQNKMEAEIATLMELVKEISREKDELESENLDLTEQFEAVSQKLASLEENGTDAVEVAFTDEKPDLNAVLASNASWSVKAELINNNFSQFTEVIRGN